MTNPHPAQWWGGVGIRHSSFVIRLSGVLWGVTGAIVQARMNSRGVPRRPLAEVGGQPLLYHIVERIQRSEGIEELVVAATTDPADKALVDHALALNVRLFRGHPLDVL